MNIKKIDGGFSICKTAGYSGVKLDGDFVFIGKTDDELSLVCRTEEVPEVTLARDDGWRLMRIEGILDFSLTGILSRISAALAENKIGIFAVSTFNTDYILVKAADYEKALRVLSDAGYGIV